MNVSIIPVPKKLDIPEGGGNAVFKALICIPEKWYAAGEAFAAYTAKAGIKTEICTYAEDGPQDPCCGQDRRCIYVKECNNSEAEGGYRLEINTVGAAVFASDISSVNKAFATLFQILNADPSNSGNMILPLLNISDAPDSSYRGMMVDLARYWHPFDFLLAYVDMCWYYKLSALQLHFTDDQSYTLPGKLYPNLSTSGRSYSFEEIKRLNKYAAARGIELIPEIDVPGHNTGFAVGYPELFGTNGIICQHADSIEAVANIFREVCDLFPDSKHIHIGGDEANLKNWLNCPRCMEYARSIGIDTEKSTGEEICDKLYVNFIGRMVDAVKSKGRIPIVWEGFPKHMNDFVKRDIVVMSWENYYQVTPDLLEAGFEIINCSWNPMYIVAPDVKWTPEEISDWSIFTWRPVHPGSPYIGKTYTCEPTDQVLGGQLLAWGDRVISLYEGNETEGARVELKLLLERIPYLAQNTWNTDCGLVYNDICGDALNVSRRIDKIALERVSGYGW